GAAFQSFLGMLDQTVGQMPVPTVAAPMAPQEQFGAAPQVEPFAAPAPSAPAASVNPLAALRTAAQNAPPEAVPEFLRLASPLMQAAIQRQTVEENRQRDDLAVERALRAIPDVGNRNAAAALVALDRAGTKLPAEVLPGLFPGLYPAMV